MEKDAEEMTAYLRKRLNKEKIVVMGVSWGGTIGTRLAKNRPEWLYAYVGVGQPGATEDPAFNPSPLPHSGPNTIRKTSLIKRMRYSGHPG